MINTTYENNTVNNFVESSMTADTFNTNREYILDKQEVIELNTYRNWGDFSMRILPWEKVMKSLTKTLRPKTICQQYGSLIRKEIEIRSTL